MDWPFYVRLPCIRTTHLLHPLLSHRLVLFCTANHSMQYQNYSFYKFCSDSSHKFWRKCIFQLACICCDAFINDAVAWSTSFLLLHTMICTKDENRTTIICACNIQANRAITQWDILVSNFFIVLRIRESRSSHI